MIVPFLEISFRHGRPFAAYLHVTSLVPVASSSEVLPGVILDRDADGVIIGLEMTAPETVSCEDIRALLRREGIDVPTSELAPLAA